MSLLAKIYRKRDENLQNLIDKKHFDIKRLNLVAIRLDKGFFG